MRDTRARTSSVGAVISPFELAVRYSPITLWQSEAAALDVKHAASRPSYGLNHKPGYFWGTCTLIGPKRGNKLTPSVVSFVTQASPTPALHVHEDVTGFVVSQVVSASMA